MYPTRRISIRLAKMYRFSPIRPQMVSSMQKSEHFCMDPEISQDATEEMAMRTGDSKGGVFAARQRGTQRPFGLLLLGTFSFK